MSEINVLEDREETSVITERWIKPPLLVTYQNSKLIVQNKDVLICEFFFSQKYYTKDFYLLGEKILKKGNLYRGRRYFFSDRFYSLLEYYSDEGKLAAYYFDITLPAKRINTNEVIILDMKLDFFVLSDKKTYFLLDEEELNEAVRANEFSEEELRACYRTTDFIEKALLHERFEDIFTKYERTSPNGWKRYFA